MNSAPMLALVFVTHSLAAPDYGRVALYFPVKPGIGAWGRRRSRATAISFFAMGVKPKNLRDLTVWDLTSSEPSAVLPKDTVLSS